MKKIDKITVLSIGTTAESVKISGLACTVQNTSDSASVYLKEKRYDGMDASSSNGWVLAPGETLPFPLTAMELSLAASAADTDVRIMILEED